MCISCISNKIHQRSFNFNSIFYILYAALLHNGLTSNWIQLNQYFFFKKTWIKFIRKYLSTESPMLTIHAHFLDSQGVGFTRDSFTDYITHRRCRISLQNVVRTSNNFMDVMYRHIAGSSPPDKNVLISHFSLRIIMFLLSQGAAGQTKLQVTDLNRLAFRSFNWD